MAGTSTGTTELRGTAAAPDTAITSWVAVAAAALAVVLARRKTRAPCSSTSNEQAGPRVGDAVQAQHVGAGQRARVVDLQRVIAVAQPGVPG